MIDAAVNNMLEHFGINNTGKPQALEPSEENFRIACMLEEVSEFVLADNIEDKYDALIDLIIFAVGTAHRMGLPVERGLLEVIRTNLNKELGPNNKRGGFKIDLRKPVGWQGPDHKWIHRRKANVY